MTRKTCDLSDSVSRAKEILSQNGNRLTLMGAFLVFMASCSFYWLFWASFEIMVHLFWGRGSVWSFLSACVFGATVLVGFTVCFLLPLFHGILLMARDMARGKETPLATVFLPFCNKDHYELSLRLAGKTFIRLTLAVVVGFLIDLIIAMQGDGAISWTWIGIGLILFEILICFFWWGRDFSFFYFAQIKASLRAARRETKAFRRTQKQTAVRYFGVFFPRILLGILTLGIYLWAQVLPLMVLTYFCECEKTHELMIHLEENKDHE